MVRTYKRKTPEIDKEKMKLAVLSVRRDKLSVRRAAELHGVKWTTLSGWLKRTSNEQAANNEVTLKQINKA